MKISGRTGAISDPTPQTKQVASTMPTDLLDLTGIVADQAAGTKNGELRTVANGVSLVTSTVVGNSKLVNLPKLVNDASNLITAGQATQYVLDTKEKLSKKDNQPKQENKVENNSNTKNTTNTDNSNKRDPSNYLLFPIPNQK